MSASLPRFTYSPVPTVSIILPVLNESAFIEGCLQAILNQTYPADRIEILVIDGGSTDDTRAKVERCSKADARVRLLDNPERIQAHALNRGIREAAGEIIIRVDGHTVIAPDYVAECVRLLQTMTDQQVVNVGGPMRPAGQTHVGRAVAAATTSPFGIPTAFHHSAQAQFVDTVYLGAWPRLLFDHIGLFNPLVNVNEDYEFNYRTRRAGGKIYLSPAIRSTYFPRASLGALWRQYFRYGVQKVQMLRRYPRSVRLRQLVAPVFVAGLFGLLPLGAVWPVALILWVALVVVYLLAASAAAFLKRGEGAPVLLVICVFGVLHTAWGLGFWRGLLRIQPGPRK